MMMTWSMKILSVSHVTVLIGVIDLNLLQLPLTAAMQLLVFTFIFLITLFITYMLYKQINHVIENFCFIQMLLINNSV